LSLRSAVPSINAFDQRLRLTGTVLEKKLTELLSHWREVAWAPAPTDLLLQRPGRLNREQRHEALCAVAAARQAALQARATVVTRPWRDSKEVVARFVEDWLNLQPADGLVEATANALLFASLDAPDPEDVDPERRVLTGQLRNYATKPFFNTAPCYLSSSCSEWASGQMTVSRECSHD
jgi:hypothetical protein